LELEYFWSNLKAKWTVARNKCCEIGLSLASIESEGKHSCLTRTMNLTGEYNISKWIIKTNIIFNATQPSEIKQMVTFGWLEQIWNAVEITTGALLRGTFMRKK
jgi:hypothetical protein